MAYPDAGKAAEGAAYASAYAAAFRAGDYEGPDYAAEKAAQAELLRCVTGNPFRRRPAVRRAWLAWEGGTVRRLAQSIYDEHRFGDLSVLADALEEAGCAHAGCRGTCAGRGRTPAAAGRWTCYWARSSAP